MIFLTFFDFSSKFGFSVSLKRRSFVRVTKVLIRLNLTISMIWEPSLTHSLTFDFLGSIDPTETWITKNQWCAFKGNRQYSMRRRWEIPINFNPLHLKGISKKRITRIIINWNQHAIQFSMEVRPSVACVSASKSIKSIQLRARWGQ